jgi:hypothetical protein
MLGRPHGRKLVRDVAPDLPERSSRPAQRHSTGPDYAAGQVVLIAQGL